VPEDAAKFNDEFGIFYVVRATILVPRLIGPNLGSLYSLTLPAYLSGDQAVVSHDGKTYSPSNYEVRLCTYMCVETEVMEGFEEFRR